MGMERGKAPLPGAGWITTLDENMQSHVGDAYSGELTASIAGGNLGVARRAGKVRGVFLSVNSCGQDDSNPLIITGEVYINGTSCLSTKPSIAYVSGESAQQKTTKISGDTGITQAVIDPDNCNVSPGDVFTYDLTLARTASPTYEINNPCLVVEFESRKKRL